jgi:hypothetical protein
LSDVDGGLQQTRFVVKPIFETVLMALFIGIAVVINLNLLIDTSQAVRYERTSYMCVRSLSPSLGSTRS